MKRILYIFVFCFVPSILFAQAAGRTIKRQSAKVQSKTKSNFEKELESCSYHRERICDNNYVLCYYMTYPSFLKRDYPSDSNDFKNVFSKNKDLKIETWELWNHIEVDYDYRDVYNLLKSDTDTYHSAKSKEVIVSGVYRNGMKYYIKAVFDKDDNVIYARMTYSNLLSKSAEEHLIKQVFGNFPN